MKYFPAAFGMASDFWRVAVVGAIAADLGEVQVAVFNTSYRIMWIVMIMVIALSSAAGIKMSNRLANMDPDGAKQAGEVGILLAFSVLCIIMCGVFFHIRMFGRIFTEDEEFLDLFEMTRVPFCCTLFLMNMSVAIERVPYSMGRTKEVFWMGLIASWGGKRTIIYWAATANTLFAAFVDAFSKHATVSSVSPNSASPRRVPPYHLLEKRSVWSLLWYGSWVSSFDGALWIHHFYEVREEVVGFVGKTRLNNLSDSLLR